jgi:hypothetical protein
MFSIEAKLSEHVRALKFLVVVWRKGIEIVVVRGWKCSVNLELSE